MKRIRIGLLIEDEAVRSAIKFALGVEGFVPVRLLKACAYALDDFLGLTALVLDLGSGSVEALTQLQKSAFPGERVIVMATAPSLTVRRLCESLGATIIEKPVLCNELVAAIRHLPPVEGIRA